MQMWFTTLVKIATFRRGNNYVSKTLLSTINATKRGTITWAKWFKVWLHKEMIIVQKKVGKVRSRKIGPTLTLVAKHWCIRIHRGRWRELVFFNAQRIQGRGHFKSPRFHS
jgi:hypothetical protein